MQLDVKKAFAAATPLAEHTATVDKPPGLAAVDIGEFLSLDIPPREMVVDPVIPTQGLVMLYARRGVGKTHVAIGLAYAVASGGDFLKWTTPKPRRVLYVDGEMPAIAMQERFAAIALNAEPEADPSYLRLITPDLQGDFGIPDLTTEEGQAEIDRHMDDVEFLILDNLSTLCRSGRENEAESWQTMQDWGLRLRRQGVSVLFVHHSGKGGQQRGTSRREDVLDTIIRLEHSTDYKAQEGARFEVHLDKARTIVGDPAAAFEAQLGTEGWTYRTLEDQRLQRVVALSNDGLKQREIATETGLSLGTVNACIKRGREKGLIE